MRALIHTLIIDPKGERSAITRETEEVYDMSTGKYGLILYNPSDRDGALEEADNLQSGLKAVGCQVFKAEWTTKAEISKQNKDGLQRITDCTLLIVCIMSHGTAGALRCDDDNRSVALNDVMFEFTRKLPPELPMVRTLCSFLTNIHVTISPSILL